MQSLWSFRTKYGSVLSLNGVDISLFKINFSKLKPYQSCINNHEHICVLFLHLYHSIVFTGPFFQIKSFCN